MPLPIVLGYVLVYAFETDRGPYIVDAGWNTDEAFDALSTGLQTAGFDIADVQGVLVTHIHPDHYGLAGRVRDTSGAWIALHPADAALIHDRYTEPDDLLAAMARNLRRAGAPQAEVDALSNAAMPVRGVRGPRAARRAARGRRSPRHPRLGSHLGVDPGPLPRSPLLLGTEQPAHVHRRLRAAAHHAEHLAEPAVGGRPARRLPALARPARHLRRRRAAGARVALRRPAGTQRGAAASTTGSASTRWSRRSARATRPRGRSRRRWSGAVPSPSRTRSPSAPR